MASETKFTPGPWSQGRRNRNCVWLQGKKEPGYGMGEGFYWIDCNTEANASLIAAAPELLHVAQMVYDAEMDWRSEGHQSIPDYALETIRAAIAKATGEQE